nr:phosphotransferase [Streptomyces sp. RPA4-2]
MEALRLVRERTKVPVPEVDFVDRSHEVCDADYFFMTHVDADNLNTVSDTLAKAESDAYAEGLGAITRELNTIVGAAFGSLTGPGDSTWRAAFLRMVEELLGDGERRGVVLPHGYDVIRDAAAAHADSLDEVTEPRFVEWDLWPGNCMVRDGRIVAIIDHERAFYGDPLMEFGFAGSESSAYGNATAFTRGYGHRPFTAAERTRRRLYNLHLALIQIIETNFRAHTNTEQYEWACAQLRETVALLGRYAGDCSSTPHAHTAQEPFGTRTTSCHHLRVGSSDEQQRDGGPVPPACEGKRSDPAGTARPKRGGRPPPTRSYTRRRPEFPGEVSFPPRPPLPARGGNESAEGDV